MGRAMGDEMSTRRVVVGGIRDTVAWIDIGFHSRDLSSVRGIAELVKIGARAGPAQERKSAKLGGMV